MPSPLDTLKAAGFPDEEVGQWATEQRATLSAGGFADDEIDAYLGGPKTPPPQAFLDRMTRGTAIGRALGDIGASIKEGWGTPEAFSPQFEQEARDIGLFNDPAKGQASPIRAMNEAIARPIGAGIAIFGAGINAGVHGIGALAGEVAHQLGIDPEKKAKNETINFLNFLMADAMGRGGAPISRINRGPFGDVHDQPIGSLPEPGEFGAAAHDTIGTAASDQAVDKIQQLWEEHGVHPAEIAHDAQIDPTIAQDLASSGPELPRAYAEHGRLPWRNIRGGEDRIITWDTLTPADFANGQTLRLYRGETAGGRPHAPGQPTTGGWFTSDPAKAARYGDVFYVDLTREDLGSFAQGHGGSDEFLTTNPAIISRAQPVAIEAPTAPEAVPGAETAPTGEAATARPAAAAEMATTAVPAELRSFSPSDLKIDAARFQFKEGGDLAGVTDRLQGVTQWDPIKSGVGIVYEDKDGVPYVVDGHQRVALADRIAREDPTQEPRFYAHVLREADGVTDADARAVAAAKNIAEGTGTAVDAAKVLRDRPDLADNLPPRSELVRQAQGLTNLSPEAFGMIVNDVVPANYAAIVGRLVPQDAKMQGALVNLLAKAEPANAVQAESIIRQGMDAGLHTETQASLFGDQEVVSSLYAGRAKILDRALKTLRRDRTVFQSIADNRAIIEELGNRLAQDENLQRAAADAQAVQILQTLANRRGALGDALTGAARGVADGSVDIAAATRDFVAAIRRQAQSGDLSRIANGPGGGPLAAPGPGPAIRADDGRGSATAEAAGAAVAKPPSEPVVAASPTAEAAASAQVQAAIKSEKTPQGEQLVIPGGELGFTTSKGSTYQVHQDGTTTRNKSFHPEHGEADQGPQRRSEATFYVSADDADKLGEFQAQGGPARIIAPLGDGRWGVKYLDGKDAGKFERRTVVTPDRTPTIGATPVEIFNGGKRVHFGNEITELRPAPAPVTERTAQGEQLVIPGAEPSAIQAAASREAEGHGRIAAPTAQEEPGGLFSEKPAAQPDIFGNPEAGALRIGGPPALVRTPAEEAILDRINVGGESDKRPWSWGRLYTNIVDKLYPLSEATTWATDGEPLKTANNPYQLARLLSGAPGKADHFLNYGTFDFHTYEVSGQSLKAIIDPMKDDLDGLRAFAASVRALELEHRGIETGMNLGAARQVAAAGVERYGPIMARLIQYQDRLTRYLRDSGVLSTEGYEAMREANRLYVPFNRVIGSPDPGFIQGGGSLQASNPIHRIKGSEREIIDPIESIIRNTYLYTTMAERNAVGTKLVDMLREASDAHGAIGDVSEAHLRDAVASPAEHFADQPIVDVDGSVLSPVERRQPDLFPERGPIAKEAPEPIRPVPPTTDESTAAAIREALRAQGLSEELFDFMASAVPVKEGEIAVYRDGRREIWLIDPEVARAVKGLDQQTAGAIEALLAKPASWLRAGAVLNPDFQIRHTFRDYLYAAITSPGFFSPVDMARGFIGLIAKDADMQRWMQSGGGNISRVALDRRYLQDSLRELNGETGLLVRAWNVVADPDALYSAKAGAVAALPFRAGDKFILNPLRMVTELVENASHLGGFKKALRGAEAELAPGETLSKERIQAAGFASRDLAVDAARIGASTRAYNMITAFANITIQDTDRVARAFISDPVGTGLKIGAGIVLPSALLWWANHDDTRYGEIPQWEKDLFWIVMTGKNTPNEPDYVPGHIFRIPKPWGMGVIFGSGTERTLQAFFDGREDPLREFGKSIADTVVPQFYPTAAAPIIDQFANRSAFTNRTLVPSELEKQLPEYQYTPYTSETAKKLAQLIAAFPGVRRESIDQESPLAGGVARALTTPILLENYLRGWSGNLGIYALTTMDAALRKAGVIPDPPKPADTLADMPVIKAFVVRYPGASTESIQHFYEDYGRNKRYFDTWMAKAQDGDEAALSRIEAAGGPRMFVQLDSIKQAMGEHSKLIRDIWKDPEMGRDEKRQLIDTLYYSEIQIGQAGRAAMRQIDAALAPTTSALQ